ncbi:MAG TPA: glycosyltransferase family 2 protein [Candidatus Thermoplasmatota archaeon]|nr:glycosyltransferase family 2 protein [Candidatus Thermoplasmatota archaeon]
MPRAVDADTTVSVIISTRNRSKSLSRALAALAKQTHPPIETIVIDNASEDDTLQMVQREFADVRVIAANGNQGFARSINAGVAQARGDVVVLLPDDVLAEPDYIEELLGALSATGAGIAGGLLLEWPDTSRINYAGATLSRILKLRFERRHLPPSDAPQPVTFVPGGNMALRRETFGRLGGFDEDYSSFFEDVDLCARALSAGERLVLAPRARAYHITHPTAATPYRAYYDRRNLALFYFKNARPLVLAGFLCYHVAIGLPRDIFWAVRQRDAGIVRAVLRGHGWWVANLGFLLRKRRARAAKAAAGLI